MKIQRLLIANRGEIARRIIRTAKQLGIHTIAIYSEADTNALHVTDADSAIALGGNSAAESYLDQHKVLNAARQSQADAIHPGYGFLSENAEFADACVAAGLIFIGPSGQSMELMGDKAQARLYMQQSGVPVLPGFDQEANAEQLQQEADKMGYPLLIKAVAGGGGKGMRTVESSAEFAATLAAAQREALHAFADDQVLLERYLPVARHVEVQIFADSLGNAVYLFERDCSVQRRHQKVIEEAPAPGLSTKLREQMGQAAVTAATSIGYVGAGTIEFLLTPDHQFYFMEMNTRLQVEHPVTEAITDTDLVAWQIAVAEGKPLPMTQQQLAVEGHAIEVRLYAEDPWQGFLPASGSIETLAWPSGIRIDTGVQQGDQVSSLYDPMIAKLVSHGSDRNEAREQLIKALDSLQLYGLRHNAGFLRQVLASASFAKADLSTQLLDQHSNLTEQQAPAVSLQALAATLLDQRADQQSGRQSDDPWGALSGWRPLGRRHHQKVLRIDGETLVVALADKQATIGNITAPLNWQLTDDHLSLSWGEQQFAANYWFNNDEQQLVLFYRGQDYAVELTVNASQSNDKDAGFTAPMNATLLLQHVKEGEFVSAGTALVTLEAMKMEHTLYASEDGTVAQYLAAVNDTVSAGSELLIFEVD